jgi:hypothetical protein
MAHYRTTIRNAARDILMELPTTAGRCYVSRYYPVAQNKLPCLCVYTLSEASEPHRIGSGRALMRTLELVVECIAEANDVLDDRLDEMAFEVEEAIGADTTLGLPDGVYDCTLTGTRVGLRQPGQETEKQTGSAVLTFEVTYRTLLASPDTAAI